MTRPKIFFTAEKTWLPHNLKGTTNLNYSRKTGSLCSPKLTSVNSLVCSNITRDITLNSFKCISFCNDPARGRKHVLCSPVSGNYKVYQIFSFFTTCTYLLLTGGFISASFHLFLIKDNQSINQLVRKTSIAIAWSINVFTWDCFSCICILGLFMFQKGHENCTF